MKESEGEKQNKLQVEQMKSLTTLYKQNNVYPVSKQWPPWKPRLPILLLPLTQFVIMNMTSYSMKYPFGQFGLSDPAMFPPELLPAPKWLDRSLDGKKIESLDTV